MPLSTRGWWGVDVSTSIAHEETYEVTHKGRCPMIRGVVMILSIQRQSYLIPYFLHYVFFLSCDVMDADRER